MNQNLKPAVLLPAFAATDDRPVTLGVLGGGQLGLMFVHVAQQMGYRTAVLDPDPNSPAGLVSHHHLLANYDDLQALASMARLCDAVTTEFENVPAESLRILAKSNPVAPQADAVAVAQDRLIEKAHFQASALRMSDAEAVGPVPYAALVQAEDLPDIDPGLFPAILKTARMGYDGKGQIQVADIASLPAAWASLNQVPCVIEKRLSLVAECSVVVARGRDGTVVNLPLQLNTHVGCMLARTEVFEGNLDAGLTARAIQAATAIATDLGYVGVLCVEFFMLEGGQLVVNEMAPRPHNSGHYTLDACDQSQFDLQVRTLAGLPLTQPRQHSAAIMLNLLGDIWFDANSAMRLPDWSAVMALPGTHLHLYGKTEARKARKMGHLNVTGASVAEVREVALKAASILGIEAF